MTRKKTEKINRKTKLTKLTKLTKRKRSLRTFIQGGNEPVTINHFVNRINTAYPKINSWKFGSNPPPQIKVLLKNYGKPLLRDDPFTIFGVDWGKDVGIILDEGFTELTTKIYTMHNDKICNVSNQTEEFNSSNKKLIFIKLFNGPIFMCNEVGNGGHQEIIKSLNRCIIKKVDGKVIVAHPIILFCQVAGELYLDGNNEIISWNCQSGTFQPKCAKLMLMPLHTDIAELPVNKYRESKNGNDVLPLNDYDESSESGKTTGRSDDSA